MADDVRVLVIGVAGLLREGLRTVIAREDGLTLSGTATAIDALARPAGRVEPGVVIIQADGTPEAAASAARAARKRWPRGAVVVLSAGADPRTVKRAFDSGASGFALTSVDEDELVRAIRAVATGGRYLDPSVGAAVAQSGREPGPVDGLSIREREVLRLVALGHTNHEVAQELVVSVRTVEGHRARVMTKLRASSRAELVRHALEGGLLDGDRAAG